MKRINIILCLTFLGIVWGQSFINDDPYIRGRNLLNSGKWNELEDGLWWNTFEKYNKWPYFMYTVCVDLPVETMMDIEVYNYQNYSKNWIPQLIKGEKVGDAVQYLQYDFYPMTNRDVCQTWHHTLYKKGSQVYINTVDHPSCPNVLKVHMFEDVHKFIYPDTDSKGKECTRMTYIGVEDPKGILGKTYWITKFLYVHFYKQHFAAYKEFLKTMM